MWAIGMQNSLAEKQLIFISAMIQWYRVCINTCLLAVNTYGCAMPERLLVHAGALLEGFRYAWGTNGSPFNSQTNNHSYPVPQIQCLEQCFAMFNYYIQTNRFLQYDFVTLLSKLLNLLLLFIHTDWQKCALRCFEIKVVLEEIIIFNHLPCIRRGRGMEGRTGLQIKTDWRRLENGT